MSSVIDARPYWTEESATSPGCMLGPRVVVAEDDPSMRQLISSVLAAEGLFVTEVGDAPSLVQVATASSSDSAEPFDLIVTDLLMPGFTGLEALERLRKAGCHAPAIVITAFLDEDGCAQLEKLDAEYLAKPFGNESLRVLANRICSAHGDARSLAACPL